MIPIPFGIARFGRCDSIRGLGYVVTRFFHISYVPIIPLGSDFILRTESNSPDVEAEVPLNGKSVVLAFGRLFLLAALAICACLVILEFLDHRPRPAIPIAFCTLEVLLLVLSYLVRGIGRATIHRARELGKLLEFTPTGMHKIDTAFGLTSDTEVDLSQPVMAGVLVRSDGLNVELNPPEEKVSVPGTSAEVNSTQLDRTAAIGLTSIVDEEGTPGQVFELRWNETVFALVDDQGRIVDQLTDGSWLAEVRFPSFFRSQTFLAITFDQSLRHFIADPKDLVILRAYTESELSQFDPEFLARMRQSTKRTVCTGFGMLILGIGAALLLVTEIPIIFIGIVAWGAGGLGVILRGILEYWHAHRLETRSKSGHRDGARVDSQFDLSTKAPGSIALERCERAGSDQFAFSTLLASAATFLILIALPAAFFSAASYRVSWSLGVRTPYLPETPKIPPVPDEVVEIPAAIENLQVISPKGSRIRVLVEDTQAVWGYWQCQFADLHIGDQSIRGKGVDDTPVSEWSASIESHLPTPERNVELIAEFDLPADSVELHQTVPFRVELRVLRAEIVAPETFDAVPYIAESTGNVFAITADEKTRVDLRKSIIDKHVRVAHSFRLYNADVNSYNHAITIAEEENAHNQVLLFRWLAGSTATGLLAVLLAAVSGRYLRTAVTAILFLGILWIDYSAWANQPEKPSPLELVEIPAQVRNAESNR